MVHRILRRASLIVQLVKNPPAMQKFPVWFLGGEDPQRRDRLPTPVFLGFLCGSAGKKSACNVGDLGLIPGLGRFSGEGKIPWRREWLPTPVFWPGEFHGLQFMGSQRVEHDWATFKFYFIITLRQSVKAPTDVWFINHRNPSRRPPPSGSDLDGPPSMPGTQLSPEMSLHHSFHSWVPSSSAFHFVRDATQITASSERIHRT